MGGTEKLKGKLSSSVEATKKVRLPFPSPFIHFTENASFSSFNPQRLVQTCCCPPTNSRQPPHHHTSDLFKLVAIRLIVDNHHTTPPPHP